MPLRQASYTSFEEAMEAEPFMAHVSELRSIQPTELSAVRDQVGDEALETQVQHEYRYSETGNTKPSVVHRADTPPCGYERDFFPSWEEDSEIREMLDEERQTAADVIERGNVVEFCASCFPELAAWTGDSEEVTRET